MREKTDDLLEDESKYLLKCKQIKTEENRLLRLFKDVDENKKKLVTATIKDAAFLTITMAELREEINRNGTVSEYKNGENQYGTKQSPESQTYIQLSQKLTQAMKILIDCIQKSGKPDGPGDDFNEFVLNRPEI